MSEDKTMSEEMCVRHLFHMVQDIYRGFTEIQQNDRNHLQRLSQIERSIENIQNVLIELHMNIRHIRKKVSSLEELDNYMDTEKKCANQTLEEKLAQNVDVLHFPVRITNVLKKNHIDTIRDLVTKKGVDLRIMGGLGLISIQHIQKKLSSIDLDLGMDISPV